MLLLRITPYLDLVEHGSTENGRAKTRQALNRQSQDSFSRAASLPREAIRDPD